MNNSILDGDKEKFNKLLNELNDHLSDKDWLFWANIEFYSQFTDELINKYAKYIAWYKPSLYCRKWSFEMIKKYKNDINWTLFKTYGINYNKDYFVTQLNGHDGDDF